MFKLAKCRVCCFPERSYHKFDCCFGKLSKLAGPNFFLLEFFRCRGEARVCCRPADTPEAWAILPLTYDYCTLLLYSTARRSRYYFSNTRFVPDFWVNGYMYYLAIWKISTPTRSMATLNHGNSQTKLLSIPLYPWWVRSLDLF